MQPTEKAQIARDNGHNLAFLTALCELMMCDDPTGLCPDKRVALEHGAGMLARIAGFTDWVEAYHGLVVKPDTVCTCLTGNGLTPADFCLKHAA